ncbi:MAG: MarR family transcriptional regulator [Actinomycetaceae bacterium]|nr:MarR family transcriptional regulator [Actinomycetaceae bacterium]
MDSAEALALTSKDAAQLEALRWRAWRVYFESTARMQDEIDSALREGAGVSLPDYNVLLLLSEAPDRKLRFKELAKRMSFSKSRLSYQVKVLAKRGLVSRQSVESDARGLYVQLTDLGVETFVRAGRLHARHVKRLMLQSLSESEAEALVSVFSRLSENLEESSQAPSSGAACKASA